MRRRVLLVLCLGVIAVTATRAAHAADAPMPRPLLVDPAQLADARAKLKAGDAPMKTALAALERSADRALALKPTSVMDKGVVPPSGDKHDYMSQAPYWWPDPAKPDGKPYIRKDGEHNPEIDKISDHDNLLRMCSTVSTLGLAYYFTGKEAYATHAAQLARVWFLDPATKMNPHLKYGQGIPGINEGRGIGIIETRALPDLLDGLALLGDSPAWTAADRAGLQTWMRAYVTWLTESRHGQEESKNGNNHETWYEVQVASLAMFTNQPDVARRIVEHARERIAAQIQPDGGMPRELERTKAWDYSAFNLTAYFRLATIGSLVGVDLWNYQTADGRGLRKAIDFMVPFAAGEKKWTYEQIAGFKPEAITDLLRRAAVVWKEPRYAALAAKIGGGSDRLDLILGA